MSPWRLPGEPNRASAVWLAAGDQTSLGGVSRLFSRSSLISSNTYTILSGELQEKKADSGDIHAKTAAGDQACGGKSGFQFCFAPREAPIMEEMASIPANTAAAMREQKLSAEYVMPWRPERVS